MLTGISKAFGALALAAGWLLFVTTAAPAAVIYYVASFGNDANDCSLATPCRTLQRGVRRARDGSVLQILDAGGYGNAASIGKSITIQAAPGTATVGRITINAPAGKVVLRGLTLNGQNVPADTPGILISSAASVHIEGCTIERFSGIGAAGINITTGSSPNVVVSDTTVRHNGSTGISIGSGIATVKSTTAASNGGAGYLVFSGELTLESVVATGNFDGVYVYAGTARISNSVVTNNYNHGLYRINGTLLSRGNNMVNGNPGGDTSGTITALGGI